MPEVLAIDFGGTKIDVGLAALDGTLLASERIATLAERGAPQAVERAIEAALRLASAADADVVAAGAVSPGIVREDGVALAPNVPGCESLALPRLLRDGLGVSAVPIANDVNAAALAEARWGALAGCDTGVLVSLGTGVKAGLVIGGRVFDGAHGAAGEIGYSVRDAADALGFVAGRAPLEEYVGGRALGERAALVLGEDVTAADVFARSDLPAGFVDDWLAVLTMHLANLAVALDPERFVLGGGLMSQADTILPALRERMEAVVPFPPAVVPARFLHDGALRGAAALAIDAATALSPEVAR